MYGVLLSFVAAHAMDFVTAINIPGNQPPKTWNYGSITYTVRLPKWYQPLMIRDPNSVMMCNWAPAKVTYADDQLRLIIELDPDNWPMVPSSVTCMGNGHDLVLTVELNTYTVVYGDGYLINWEEGGVFISRRGTVEHMPFCGTDFPCATLTTSGVKNERGWEGVSCTFLKKQESFWLWLEVSEGVESGSGECRVTIAGQQQTIIHVPVTVL